MKYLIFMLLVAFTSCNVAKKVFRHKESSVIQIKKDSTGSTETHMDTSKQSGVRVIKNTEIVKDGGILKGKGSTDVNQLKTAILDGKPMVVPLLDSVGKVMGYLSTSFNPLTNALDQLVNMNESPTYYKGSTDSTDNRKQSGITDQKQNANVNQDNTQKNKNQGTVKEVKRSPAWIKISLMISGVIIVLLALFNRGKIWKWLKNKILKK